MRLAGAIEQHQILFRIAQGIAQVIHFWEQLQPTQNVCNGHRIDQSLKFGNLATCPLKHSLHIRIIVVPIGFRQSYELPYLIRSIDELCCDLFSSLLAIFACFRKFFAFSKILEVTSRLPRLFRG